MNIKQLLQIAKNALTSSTQHTLSVITEIQTHKQSIIYELETKHNIDKACLQCHSAKLNEALSANNISDLTQELDEIINLLHCDDLNEIITIADIKMMRAATNTKTTITST